MLVRLAILAACAAALALLASSLRAHDACSNARRTVFEVAVGHLSAAREPAALDTIQAQCRGTDGLVAAAAALQRQGRAREALALAFRATRREPQSATAWNAFASAARADGRYALAQRAAARERELSPLDR